MTLSLNEAAGHAWVYSDGACSGNPGPGGWAYTACLFSGLGVGTVVEGGGFEAATTNNRMEMLAACESLERCVVWAADFRAAAGGAALRVTMFTDSKLLIRGITQWIHGWKRKNWVKSDGAPVLNRDLWGRLDRLAHESGLQVEWLYVAGHSGVEGNERVDRIAVAHSQRAAVELYEGPLDRYALRRIFLNRPLSVSVEGNQSGASTKRAAPKVSAKPYYVSLVDGAVLRHVTWEECERRVKGVGGAKFKKVSSTIEEADVLKRWGLKL